MTTAVSLTKQSSTPSSLTDQVRAAMAIAGPGKPMGESSPVNDRPHFYLVRRFLNDVDLLTIFNTKRCRFSCHFCDLPTKSIGADASQGDLETQFGFVVDQVKPALSVLTKLTLSNEGSVFDEPTFDQAALDSICEATIALPALRTIALETRLEFVTSERISEIRELTKGKKQLDILTGFETLDEYLRDEILFKREPLDGFLAGLDLMAEQQLSLSTYVLFKPHYEMSDGDAMEEARNSIEFLRREAEARGIPLMVRLNPMYAATRTKWADQAVVAPGYRPPRLTDVLSVAKEARANGVSIYLGLSAEGLAEENRTYRAREDFDTGLLKEAIRFNQG